MNLTKFITLEEFFSLKDPDYDYPRSIHFISISPEQWIQYYHCSKANWEKFGDDGPLIGTNVITLKPGHCGRENELRTIVRFDNGVCGPCFVLSKSNDEISLSRIKFWWLDFTVPELSPFTRGKGWRI